MFHFLCVQLAGTCCDVVVIVVVLGAAQLVDVHGVSILE